MRNKNRSSSQIGSDVLFALFVTYFVWGTTYYAMRVALHAYPPFFLSSVRFLIAGGMLFLWTAATGSFRFSPRLLLDAVITGFLLVTLGNGLVVMAEQYVSSGIAALVVSAESVFILILSMFYGGRLSLWQFIGVALCLSGVVLLVLGTELRYSPVALTALLFAALAWAFGSIWSGQHAHSSNPLTLVSLQMLIGGVISMVIAWFMGEPLTLKGTFDSNLAIVYLAFLGSIATFVSYNYLIRKVSPSLATSYAYVNPAIAFVVGCIFDKDVFHISTALSLLGILAGIWLIVQNEAKSGCAAEQHKKPGAADDNPDQDLLG